MADSPRFLSYVFVVLVSMVIVALGAHELEQRYARRGGSPQDMRTLVERLQGDTSEVRASMSGKSAASTRTKRQDNIEQEDQEELQSLLDKIVP